MARKKPWWKQLTFWGTLGAGITAAGGAWIAFPPPLRYWKAAEAFGIATGLFGASRIIRDYAHAKREQVEILKVHSEAAIAKRDAVAGKKPRS